MCLDIEGGGAFAGVPVVLKECNGTNTQKWTMDAQTGLIQSQANTSLCLDAGSTGGGGNCTSGGPNSKLPFCDPGLPVEERVEDLVGRLLPIEKSLVCSNHNPGVARLGVPHIPFAEALHGVVSSCGTPGGSNSTGCPSSFPHALALGATFNRSLWTQIGRAIGIEARALHNEDNLWTGLMAWTPDINLFAAPQWGRGQEVPGEDSLLNAEYAAAFISAMTGEEESLFDLIGATAKHATVYGREDPGNYTRHTFTADVLWSELVSYYWVQWRSAIQRGKTRSIMCSYNAVSTEDMPSTPSCANDFFPKCCVPPRLWLER
jgi:beta-glucosidase-like glycosyl hydrolase